MAGYEEQAKVLQNFGSGRLKDRKKSVAKSGNMETSDADYSVDQGIADAMNILDRGDGFSEEKYVSDNSFIKNFVSIIDSTGRKTKENSNMFSVVQAVEALNDPSFVASAESKNGTRLSEDIQKKSENVINACDEYIENSNPWTSSGKQRKALVQALRLQVSNLYKPIQDDYKNVTGRIRNYLEKSKKENSAGGSLLDVLSGFERYTDAVMVSDISKMSDEDRASLKDSIMSEYGLSEDEADGLFEYRQDIAAMDTYLGGTGVVTADTIRKLASQYDQKRKNISGKTAAKIEGETEKENQAALAEASDYCKKEWGIDFRAEATGNTIIRVIVSLMDRSGTKEAKLRNAELLKSYATTHKDKNNKNGVYYKMIKNFLEEDLTIFEKHDPQYVIDNYKEINARCHVGSEIIKNIIPNMRTEIGMEPDEATMTNVNALAQLMSDFVMYSLGIHRMFTSQGIFYTDTEQFGEFDNLLNERYGELQEKESITGEWGNQRGVDSRVNQHSSDMYMLFEDSKRDDGSEFETKAISDGMVGATVYTFTKYKGSIKEVLKSLYGWKDLKDGPKFKTAPKEEDKKAKS